MELTVHIESEPNWTLDETLYEVKSVVTLMQNRISQVPAMDVVIHFTDHVPELDKGDDLPFFDIPNSTRWIGLVHRNHLDAG